jgi:hypothetical protein
MSQCNEIFALGAIRRVGTARGHPVAGTAPDPSRGCSLLI